MRPHHFGGISRINGSTAGHRRSPPAAPVAGSLKSPIRCVRSSLILPSSLSSKTVPTEKSTDLLASGQHRGCSFVIKLALLERRGVELANYPGSLTEGLNPARCLPQTNQTGGA